MRTLYTWACISTTVLAATAGDVLVAMAMRRIGDLGDFRREHGVAAVIIRVASSGVLFGGIFFMTIAFFSNLTALSWADLSLVGPTSAALTFIGNAIGAKFFLHERVDRRRWFATIFVSFGVLLLTQS